MNKFTTKDLINTGVFSVLIIITYFMAGLIGHVPFLMPFLPFMAAITGSIAYMLYTTKIKKFGMLSITMALFMLLFIASGHGGFVVPGGIISVIVAELLLKKGKYESINYARWSYVAFNFFGGFMFLPIFISRDAMTAKFLSRGKSMEYVENFYTYFPSWMLPVIILLALVGAFIGATIAIKILNKHFKKAGMI